MAHRPSVSSALAIVGFSLALAGCGGGTDSTVVTTTTAAPSTTSETLATTTTTTAEGPQPLVSGSLLEPGEYITTLFEPTVVYRIEREYLLRGFQA